MIRRSVVLKLWLTIIGLVVVVLAILALYLQQFFISYVQDLQRSNLAAQTLLTAKLLSRESKAALSEQIRSGTVGIGHTTLQFLVSGPSNPALARFLRNLPQSDRSSLLLGQPLIRSGAPDFAQRTVSPADLYALVPIGVRNGGRQVYLLVAESLDIAGVPARTIPELIIFSVVVGTLLTTGLAFVVLKNLSRPLLEMNKAAELLAQGRFDIRVHVVTQDEVGRLGRTFNHVAAELERTVYALTREKEEIAGILGAMTDGVITADTVGQVTLLNPAARQLLAFAHRNGDQDMAWTLPIEWQAMHRDTLAARRTIQRELSLQERRVTAVMTPLYEPDDPGRLRGALAVLRDVTEERRLERLRKDFVANVSHELRTPLALFQGYAEALLDDFGDDPAQRRELTQIIHDESLRMRRLVNDLLDLAQMESEHFLLRRYVVDLEALIRRVARKFSGAAAERGLTIQVLATQGLSLCADADRLEQVLINLVDNALRHTAQGGVTLKSAVDGNEAVIQVIDTGEGIPTSDLPFVFERFYKADKARTRVQGGIHGGTGLGLAIAKALVRAHGGDITVSSAANAGTTFSITIPISATPCSEQGL